MAGVQQNDNKKWTWTCSACEVEGVEFDTRDQARADYRAHRRDICEGPGDVVKTKPPKKTTKKKAAPKQKLPGEGQLWRVATVTNPKTGNPVTVHVRKDGTQSSRFSHLPNAKKWTEVRAHSWADATAAVRAGQGKEVRV